MIAICWYRHSVICYGCVRGYLKNSPYLFAVGVLHRFLWKFRSVFFKNFCGCLRYFLCPGVTISGNFHGCHPSSLYSYTPVPAWGVVIPIWEGRLSVICYGCLRGYLKNSPYLFAVGVLHRFLYSLLRSAWEVLKTSPLRTFVGLLNILYALAVFQAHDIDILLSLA